MTNDSSWADSALDLMVRERLQYNYSPFKLSVKQLNKKIILLARKLKLDEDFRAPWISETGVVDKHARDRFFRSPFNRIRGGFSSKKFQGLLSSLDEDVSRMITLTSGAIALEPLRLERKRRKNTAYWTALHHQAERLFQVFHSQWSSSCICQCLHRASMRLEVRRDFGSDEPPSFKLLFTTEMNVLVTKTSWNWRAAEIMQSDMAISRNRTQRKHPCIAQDFSHTGTSDKEAQWNQCLSSASKIQNLCHALVTTRSNSKKSCCIGVLEDAKIGHHIHAISLLLPKSSTITLGQILHDSTQTGFSVKEKCSLALTLASMVLHLHDTPWLEDTWSMNDIHVVNPQTLLADQPYVSRNFSASSSLDTPMQQSAPSFQIIRNSVIFALGVALLEISYGKALSSFETPDDTNHGRGKDLTDYLIAHRLVETLATRELRQFADAIRRCIYCDFDSSVCSLKDDGFRERFYQGVIVPLQKDYDYVMDNDRKP